MAVPSETMAIGAGPGMCAPYIVLPKQATDPSSRRRHVREPPAESQHPPTGIGAPADGPSPVQTSGKSPTSGGSGLSVADELHAARAANVARSAPERRASP